jgi:hypothetical protein
MDDTFALQIIAALNRLAVAQERSNEMWQRYIAMDQRIAEEITGKKMDD